VHPIDALGATDKRIDERVSDVVEHGPANLTLPRSKRVTQAEFDLARVDCQGVNRHSSNQ
jgi:hypothetical protein